jgi:reactive intermediate/imine deaminase
MSGRSSFERLRRRITGGFFIGALSAGLFRPLAASGAGLMTRKIIHTDRAPKAIGTYSQAVRAGDTVYLSGQIPLDPATMELVTGDIEKEIRRVFENLKAVAEAAGGSLAQAVKVNVYLTDLANFAKVNEVMAAYITEPYPARAAVGVAQLPRGARVEIECVLYLG